jgi:hypothetical protein
MMNPDARRAMHAEPLPPGALRTGYLLIDPCNLDEYSLLEPLPMLRCTPAALTNSDEVMPRLVDVAELTPLQQDSLTEVMEAELHGERPPLVCAWLECAFDARALARHVSRFLVGPGADSGDILWRYYDPRVFASAVSVFRPAQSQALLGPVLTWRFPWWGRWWRVDGTGQEIASLKGVAPAWPDVRQWASLDGTAQVSRVLAELAYERGEMADADCLRLLREVAALMEAGKQRFNLSDSDALVGYALMNVRYGAEFRHHPKLVAAWSELQQGRIHWHELTALLDETDYQAMSAYAPTSGLFSGEE